MELYNFEDLLKSIELMASLMGMEPLPNEKAKNLINYIMYSEEYGNQEGREGLKQLEMKYITERELRNLMMCNTATKISSFNKIQEPGIDKYSTKELTESFELAIFGRKNILFNSDVKDKWEL